MAITPTTWNPADRDDGTVTLSGGNLVAVSAGGSVRSIYSTKVGKYYWEITTSSDPDAMLGVGTALSDITSWPGSSSNDWGIECSAGTVYHDWSPVAQATPWSPSGEFVVSVLLDMDSGTLGFWLNGVDTGVAVSVPVSLPMYAIVGGDLSAATANFGASPFAYTPPAGYFAGFGEPLMVANLVVEPAGASVLLVGTPELLSGSPQSIAPVGVTVLGVGAPAAVAYSDRQMSVPSTALLSAGSPSVLYDPILATASTILPERAAVLNVGTPNVVGSTSTQVVGTSLLASGTPSLASGVRPQGVSLLAAGAPSVGARAMAAGGSVLRVGKPSVTVTLRVAGDAALRVGMPRAVSDAFVIEPVGVNVFSAGLPSAPSVTVHPWSKTHCRGGTPKATRGSTC